MSENIVSYPKYSIIIPVYMCEAYIRKCIYSVLEQTSKDYELILVDNGTTDNSFKICEEYEKNPNVKLLRIRENKGISGARNFGLREAKGEYIIFLDSDDFYVDKDMLLKLSKIIEENSPDIIMLQDVRYLDEKDEFAESKRKFNADKINGKSKTEIIRYLIKTNKYNGAAWNKVIKRTLLIDNDLFFKDEIRGEDVEWFHRVITKINSVYALDDVVHAYRVRSNSTSKTGWNVKCWLDIYSFLKDEVNNIDFNDECRLLTQDFFASYYYILLGMANRYENPDTYIHLLEDIRDYRKIKISRKNKICNLIISLFGVRNGSKILYKYMLR